jgi:hypothetical protein
LVRRAPADLAREAMRGAVATANTAIIINLLAWAAARSEGRKSFDGK